MDNLILKATALEKSFSSPHGSIPVLRRIDFEVKAGESISIRGESGSGKSTFLSLISALDRPDSGSLHWKGYSVFEHSTAWQARFRSTFMGMVFQAYHLMPELNALENVVMASRIARRPIKDAKTKACELLERVGLKDRIKHRTNQLSGGECQRIAIARALLNQPELILADEPTGNLDETTGKVVMQLLMELCKEASTSLVLVTHNEAFAQQTDHQLSLKAGQLTESGNVNS